MLQYTQMKSTQFVSLEHFQMLKMVILSSLYSIVVVNCKSKVNYQVHYFFFQLLELLYECGTLKKHLLVQHAILISFVFQGNRFACFFCFVFLGRYYSARFNRRLPSKQGLTNPLFQPLRNPDSFLLLALKKKKDWRCAGFICELFLYGF